jgi:hypothetical protein
MIAIDDDPIFQFIAKRFIESFESVKHSFFPMEAAHEKRTKTPTTFLSR